MKTVIAAALIASAGAALAQATPVGLWKTIDDDTKQEKSLVRVTEQGGVISGKVEKLSDPSKAGALCDKCEGARKDKPIVGISVAPPTVNEDGTTNLTYTVEITNGTEPFLIVGAMAGG